MKLTIAELQKKVDQKAATASSKSTKAGKLSYYAEKRAKQKKKWEAALVCKHCNGKNTQANQRSNAGNWKQTLQPAPWDGKARSPPPPDKARGHL
jgi:hypothetical protein